MHSVIDENMQRFMKGDAGAEGRRRNLNQGGIAGFRESAFAADANRAGVTGQVQVHTFAGRGIDGIPDELGFLSGLEINEPESIHAG